MSHMDLYWIEVCEVDDIDEGDVIRFDYGDKTFTIYRTDKGVYYATDGYCTHERFHLADGLVMGTQIACQKNNGGLDSTTGERKRAPICEKIKTYQVRVENGKVFLKPD